MYHPRACMIKLRKENKKGVESFFLKWLKIFHIFNPRTFFVLIIQKKMGKVSLRSRILDFMHLHFHDKQT